MKQLLYATLCLVLAACGSDSDPYFPGTWQGDLVQIGNDCPFPGPADQNQLFPVVISELNEEELSITAADGNRGTATVNEESFQLKAPAFAAAPAASGGLLGCIREDRFGFFAADESDAQSQVTVTYTNCTDASGKEQECAIAYAGSAHKVN